ncbi:cyclic nucleotide-binding domain-containing protein [Parachlamydia sp. AcF125]|uniref:cyclic nucleotide-binding domain-containing protein n=1 Tax=Parachlamydia sp. AcF125 TaxID=2795736 RepID=UPI00201623D4|nr:cyclic nucleotide-binding domain-containing protein [Parachlamydia sp. AcF125]
MDIQQQKELEFLKAQSLLKGLSEENLRVLQRCLLKESFKPNDTIIEENSTGTELYLIQEGEVSVLKWDEERFSQVLLGKLSKGEMFGEMSFMDNSPRSTTVKAIRPTVVYKLSKKALSTHSTPEIQNKIFENIAVANIHRLRHSNQLYVKNVQGYQALLHEKHSKGHFFIYESLLLAFSVLFGCFSTESRNDLPWMIAFIPSLLLMRFYRYPWEHVGLHFKGWKTHLLSACIASLFALGGLYLSKEFLSLKLFLNVPTLSQLAFIAVATFAQELIGRGIFQTAVQDFMDDKKGYQSVLITACFILIFFLPLGWQTSLLFFCVSFPMGILFNQQKSVWGIFLLHWVLRAGGVISM